MSRFHLYLAVFALLLLLVPLGAGFTMLGGRLNEFRRLELERQETDQTDARRAEVTARLETLDRLLGLLAGLVVLLVNGIVITYFIGTSRWCKEVATTYGMDDALWRTAAALKRKTFPWSATAMAAVVVMIALGGAADPSTGRADTSDWVQWHSLGALAGVALVAWVFYIQWNNVAANGELIERIMGEVKRIRSERGLETEG